MYLNRKDKIEAYLEGRLSMEKRQAFERALGEDTALKEAFDEQLKLINAIQEMEFRGMLGAIHKEQQPQFALAKRQQLRKIWIGIAASLLVLVSAYWLFIYTPNRSFDFELANIELYPGLPTTLGVTSSPEFGEGMIAYKKGDYQSAVTYWKPLLAADEKNDTLLFYLSQIDLANNKDTSALTKLTLLQSLENNTFRIQTDWYLALTKLRLDDTQGAVELLKEVVKKGGYQVEKTKTLIERVEEIR